MNNDNGLQDWKVEHQSVTKCICHKGISGYSSIVARSFFFVGRECAASQLLTVRILDRC